MSGGMMFYILDVVIFAMFAKWAYNTSKIKVKTKVGARWLIPVFFFIIAGLGFTKYTGTFKYVQTGALILFGICYYFLGSGLSEEGIVMNGALTKWEDAGTVTISENDSCIIFRLKKRNAALYFREEQLKDVRAFLAEKAVKSSNDKSKVV